MNPINFDRKYYAFSLLLSIVVLLETVSFTYMQEKGYLYYYSSSILYFLCGLMVCLLPLIPIGKGSNPIKGIGKFSKYTPFLFILLFLVILGYHLDILIPLYRNITIDKAVADMLPAIRIACQRLLAGETVYAPTPQIWPNTVVQYFPTMWMPFLPAEIFKFDYRWITFGLQFLGIALILKPVFNINRNIPFIPSAIAGIGLFLFLNYFMVKDPTYWAMTEEGVVTGFYLFLSFALLRRNYWLIGIAMMCCTLSRYSLVFWIPVYFGYVFFTGFRSDFWKLFLSYGLSMSLFFIIPFFVKDPAYFFHIPATYTRFIDRFWLGYDLDKHLYYNVGFFKFFTFSNHGVMTVLEVITSFAAPVILLSVAQKLKQKFELNDRYMAYASLKISLIFFFGFIQMPYMYVFVPVTLISYTVLFDYLVLQNSNKLLSHRI